MGWEGYDGKGDVEGIDGPTSNGELGLDRLNRVFEMQEAFMRVLQRRDGLEAMPEWPIDITKKSNQQVCRNLAFFSMQELFEAVQHLKNSKSHRKTEIKEFDREAFLEELVDAFKLFLEILIFVGITPDEFYDAYVKKDAIIHDRIANGY